MARSARTTYPGGTTRIELGELGRVRIQLRWAPYVSVMALIADVLGGRSRGAPEPWRELVRGSVRGSGATHRPEVAAALAFSSGAQAPDCLAPAGVYRDGSMPSALERLSAIRGEDLLADLHTIFGDGPLPSGWRDAARSPQRWLRDYANLVAEVSDALAPLLRATHTLLEREIERVGAALVTGSVDVLFSSLHARARVEDETLLLPDWHPERFDMRERQLVLLPMLAGSGALLVNLEGADTAWFGYPLPGSATLGGPDAAVPVPRGTAAGSHRQLELLLGRARTDIVLVLDSPLTMGELAASLGIAGNALSYHCRRLEAIGLVSRRRYGRSIRISRTERAETMLDTFLA